MKCDICGTEDAVMMIQQVSENAKTELHLCLKCAAERGVQSKDGKIEMSLAGLFEGITAAKNAARLCPVCGRSLGDIRKTGLTGCPECYNIFASEIAESMRAQGLTGPYTGSMPGRLANFRSVLTDRMFLRSKLDESVAAEDYEKAAVYRDRLKALDKCAVASGDVPQDSDSEPDGISGGTV
ncbi:UvrB/UvrC motif-containing protein [Treponema brennaborense]|uniref:UvrB/UvrC protein n=1 Tax=Treponema brennaborense (strain DSM 12168 / CIP 105900 / DD5/3) TaxID=906968 RepID=F4LJV2_TREBD|nr:UvrB/UvrC motif-containing protein [Treponema brennaborense]AEE16432.1 UvrB/UvrC protein [Treponema brennaborense DSM 12168]